MSVLTDVGKHWANLGGADENKEEEEGKCASAGAGLPTFPCPPLSFPLWLSHWFWIELQNQIF